VGLSCGPLANRVVSFYFLASRSEEGAIAAVCGGVVGYANLVLGGLAAGYCDWQAVDKKGLVARAWFGFGVVGFVLLQRWWVLTSG